MVIKLLIVIKKENGVVESKIIELININEGKLTSTYLHTDKVYELNLNDESIKEVYYEGILVYCKPNNVNENENKIKNKKN